MKKTTLEDVLKVIQKWEKSNDVCFISSFVTFDKDFEVIEDRMIAYGTKEAVKISLNALSDEFKKDKEEFINW